ncbi:MAG: dihydroorotase family protein [Asgard group archaeon]|nr:dihydroorotase family protein [Asgard group archaeon]
MPIDLNIINGKIFTEEGFKEGGLAIEGDRIIKIGKEPTLPKSSETIKVNGALILPGLIDIHVHTRDFDQKYKETLETGTRSALAGGITTILDMPNNKPPTNTITRIKAKEKLISEKAAANIGFYSLIPENEKEIKKLVGEGIFGFKIYPASDIYPTKNDEMLRIKLKQIAQMKIPLIIHPDTGFASEIEKELMNKSNDLIDAFLKSHNQEYEAQALKDFIRLNDQIDCYLHCAHVTAKETVNVLETNIANEFLSSEVCAHHLMLNESDLRKFKSEAKCLPPIRTKADQEALWNALRNDTIKIIATDHAPHSYNEKHCEFEEAASGIHGLETLVPLMFTSALKGKITLEQVILALTTNPAKNMKITNRGLIEKDYFADITILAKEKSVVNQENFESKAKWSPFNGFKSLVKIKYVFVNGQLAKEDDYLLSKLNNGKVLKRKLSIERNLLEEDES